MNSSPEPQTDSEAEQTAGSTKETGINFFAMAIWVEGGMIVVAITLGWFGICDPSQKLTDLNSVSVLQPAFIWGLLALIPMLVLLLAALRLDWPIFRSLRNTIQSELLPYLKDLNLFQLAVISILAGIGEEMLFRWSLQGWLTEWLDIAGKEWLSAVIVGTIFGLCHWITVPYAILTTIIGVFLGAVMIWSGTYLAPAFAHAAYDFVALIAVIRMVPESDSNDAKRLE